MRQGGSRSGILANHGQHFDWLGRRKFGDGKDKALRSPQAQQRGQRAARARLDDQRRRAGSGSALGDEIGDAFADGAGEFRLDYRLAGGRILKALER